MKSNLITRSQQRAVELYYEGTVDVIDRAGIAVSFCYKEKKWSTAPDWWFQIYQVTYRASSFGSPNVSSILQELTPSEMQNRDFSRYEVGVRSVRTELLSTNRDGTKFELLNVRELLTGTFFELWQNGNVLMQQNSSYLKETGRLLQEKLKREIERCEKN